MYRRILSILLIAVFALYPCNVMARVTSGGLEFSLENLEKTRGTDEYWELWELAGRTREDIEEMDAMEAESKRLFNSGVYQRIKIFENSLTEDDYATAYYDDIVAVIGAVKKSKDGSDEASKNSITKINKLIKEHNLSPDSIKIEYYKHSLKELKEAKTKFMTFVDFGLQSPNLIHELKGKISGVSVSSGKLYIYVEDINDKNTIDIIYDIVPLDRDSIHLEERGSLVLKYPKPRDYSEEDWAHLRKSYKVPSDEEWEEWKNKLLEANEFPNRGDHIPFELNLNYGSNVNVGKIDSPSDMDASVPGGTWHIGDYIAEL